MSHRHLTAQGLVASYPDTASGRREVLHGVDLDVVPRSRLALLGANGSGKSTLLAVLAGALRPDAGEVRVDGAALSHDRAGLRRHRTVVQSVAQNPDDQLFAADVARDVSFGPLNLGLPEDEVRRRVHEALERLSIADLAERPIHELSFGQRKRVAIAGALAMEPCVLLLDEPTAGLDPEGITEMARALDHLRDTGTTVVIATHDLDFALAWADTAAVLVDGRLSVGPASQLLADAGLMTAARLRLPMLAQVAAALGVPAGVRGLDDLLARLPDGHHPTPPTDGGTR